MRISQGTQHSGSNINCIATYLVSSTAGNYMLATCVNNYILAIGTLAPAWNLFMHRCAYLLQIRCLYKF